MPGQRPDKWLWCARLVKTRSGAARLIEAGKVRINGTRALKPSRLVKAGDVLTATPLGKLSVVRVLGSLDRRGAGRWSSHPLPRGGRGLPAGLARDPLRGLLCGRGGEGGGGRNPSKSHLRF